MKVARTRRINLGVVAFVVLATLFATSCSQLMIDETLLTVDQMQGRQNDTPGSVLAQNYIIGRLGAFSVGLDSSKTGADAFKQPFTAGTNILAKIPGTDLANQYIVIGAHYDHLGSTCRTNNARDVICNGATDNAAGVSELLAIGDLIKAHGSPRRTVVLALWDREEDGLLGSKYYTQHPLVPLAQTAAYINFDIQGANLLPSLQNFSFAVGAESGGATLGDAVQAAVGGGPLQTKLVSSIFGEGRSDYVNFNSVGVPNVFFSDSTGPCYHTSQDDLRAVDFWKLDQQVQISYRLAQHLIDADDRPTFSASNPLATFGDAVTLQEVTNSAIADIARFTPTQQQKILTFRDQVNALVAAGPASFDSTDITPLVTGAVGVVGALTSGTCDGFISQH